MNISGKYDFSSARRDMVERQLRSRGIKDKHVLSAMGKVPREKFVPESEKEKSYMDGPLPIGDGQTISQPYIVAYMTEKLDLEGDEKVLELGTGSGYQTAILAEIVKEVYSIELLQELSTRAENLLKNEMGYKNISFLSGNGSLGWEEHSPFNRIIITAAPERFPEQLFDQLEEGGIAIAPIGDYFQSLFKYNKNMGKITSTSLLPVSFVPFIM
ncbi:MAG: protein-L-isoaspartate(D-aspartate) O-methyltransferase [Acidobacteriota bacterium]